MSCKAAKSCNKQNWKRHRAHLNRNACTLSFTAHRPLSLDAVHTLIRAGRVCVEGVASCCHLRRGQPCRFSAKMWCCCVPMPQVAKPTSARVTLLPRDTGSNDVQSRCALAYAASPTQRTMAFLNLADILSFRRVCNAAKQIVREYVWQLSEHDDSFPTIVRGEQLAAVISAFTNTHGITFTVNANEDSAVVSRCARLKRSRLLVVGDPPNGDTLSPLRGRLQSATIPCTAKMHDLGAFSSCTSLCLTYDDRTGMLPWSFPEDAFHCLLALERLTLAGFPGAAMSWSHLQPILPPKGRLATVLLHSCSALEAARAPAGVTVTVR